MNLKLLLLYTQHSCNLLKNALDRNAEESKQNITAWKEFSSPHPFGPLLLAEPVDAPPDQAEDGERDHGEQGDNHPAKKIELL